MLDVFSGDGFTVTELTTAINKLPFKPARLGQMGLFKTEPISTTSVNIEEQQGKLQLVPSAARGGPATPSSTAKRKLRSFNIVHLPLEGKVYADDVQGVRAFGEETQLETVSQKVNDVLGQLRQSLEFTHEWHRIAAIQGLLLDADGSELYNWFDEFDITEETVNLDLTAPRGMKLGAHEIQRLIEDALGMDTYTGIHAFCGKNAFDAITTCNEVTAAYDRWKEGSFLREGQSRKTFEYADISWEEYRGKVGATPFIGDNEIRVFPLGTHDIFKEHYGPANYEETVNTRGKAVYAKQEKMKFGKGIDIEAQSNPLIMCCRPSVLINVTFTPEETEE